MEWTEIKDKIREGYIFNVIPELSPQWKGKYLIVTCPQCGERRAYMYPNTMTIKCNRKNNCNYHSSLWGYIKERDRLETSKEVLFRFAELVNCSLNQEQENLKPRQQASQQTKSNAFPCWLLNIITNMARENVPINVETFMEARGLDKSLIEKLYLGFFSAEMAKKLNHFLVHKRKMEPKKAWYLSSYFKNRLIFPHFDIEGKNVCYIAGRTLDWQEEKVKYKNSPGEKCLYGLPMLKQLEGRCPVFLCEGQTDLVTLHEMGIWNSLGVPGTGFNEKWISLLPKGNTYFFIFDNDSAGENHRQKIGELFERHSLKYVNVYLPKQFNDINAFWVDYLSLRDLTIIDYIKSSI